MPVMKKITASAAKATTGKRGRPKGSKNVKDSAYTVIVPKAAPETLYRFYSKKCGCEQKTSIKPSRYTMIVCQHKNELDYVGVITPKS